MVAALVLDVPLAAQGPVAPPGPPNAPLGPHAPMAPQPPEEEFRDIVPPVGIPVWNAQNLALAAALGLLVLSGLGYLIAREMRRPQPAPPPPDPRQIALRGLFHLRSAADGDMTSRDFAAAVAEILRQFLEANYRVAAPKQTTEEFLESAQTSGKFPPQAIDQLRAFLTQCDVLKFAQGAASTSAKHGLLNIAEAQVKEASR